MRVLNIHGPGDLRLDAKPVPLAADHDVTVRIKACGICGSDLSYVKRGGLGRAHGGIMPIGHEASGEVVGVGRHVEGIFPGQRVIINPMNSPSFIGSGGPEGGFSDEVLVKDARIGDSILPFADDVPFDIAALAEPLAVALHGVNRAEVTAGEKVVVFGCGPIGLGMVLWLVERGANVVAIDLSPARLARATSLGAAGVIDASTQDVPAGIRALHGTHRNRFGRNVADTDAFIDAAGAAAILGQVISLAKYRARHVVTAVYDRPVEVDLGAALTTEMVDVVAALPRLKDVLASFITHRFAFDDIFDGFAAAADPGSTKVMIEFGKEPR